ncbi:MAG: PilZ domain-containing protein [Deltaproteobacteria bacterium]|nr:PilZ domain-containing protein [Deltaproteobacteria bacterium]
MENKRKFSRFDTQMKAQYVLKGKKGGRGECTVVDISRKGMGIKFRTPEKINLGSTIRLEISIPTELDHINVEGILKRINQKEKGFIGGIEWYLVGREGLNESELVRSN